jgi:hypothetical protein
MDRLTNQKATQRNRLLDLLKSQSPSWVPISEVVSIAGFQYGARILELRRLGHSIENHPGVAFRLVSQTLPTEAESTAAAEEPCTENARLFPDDAPPRHLDLG